MTDKIDSNPPTSPTANSEDIENMKIDKYNAAVQLFDGLKLTDTLEIIYWLVEALATDLNLSLDEVLSIMNRMYQTRNRAM